MNYSSLARTQGLILHTEVGIGYETPWRQVEAMLIQAAERTPGLAMEPRPFILQTKLGDFAVTYELNVYCSDVPKIMQLYTALHRSILDVFNEYGVQIMTPRLRGDPPEPKIVRREDWYAAPAAAANELFRKTMTRLTNRTIRPCLRRTADRADSGPRAGAAGRQRTGVRFGGPAFASGVDVQSRRRLGNIRLRQLALRQPEGRRAGELQRPVVRRICQARDIRNLQAAIVERDLRQRSASSASAPTDPFPSCTGPTSRRSGLKTPRSDGGLASPSVPARTRWTSPSDGPNTGSGTDFFCGTAPRKEEAAVAIGPTAAKPSSLPPSVE